MTGCLLALILLTIVAHQEVDLVCYDIIFISCAHISSRLKPVIIILCLILLRFRLLLCDEDHDLDRLV